MEEQDPPGARGAPWGLSIVAVIALIMGWVAVSAWQRSEVEVSWASPIACQGGGVRMTGSGALVDVRRGTRCRLVVHVANHGWSSAHLGRVTLPGMGSRGALPLRAERIGTQRPDDVDGDAVLDLSRSLGAGDDLTMTVELAYNPQMCAAAGTSGTALPVLTVSTYEQAGDRTAAERLSLRVARQQQGAACGS